MNLKKALIHFVFACLSISFLCGQSKHSDSTGNSNAKSGWSFGAIPVVAYESDIGFKYGALTNLYDYGDGSIYPGYKHSIYLEWSRTTKGSGINKVSYDSKFLIPGVRTSGELSYLTEKGLDFFGFNGYKAFYNNIFEEDTPGNQDYRSRMFFKQDRKMFRLRADFMGKFLHKSIHWIAGIVHYDIKLDTIDIHTLNKGKEEGEKLPFVNGGLFGNYKTWNVLPLEHHYGGRSILLKAGFVFDTRDNEPNPMSGIWTEAFIVWAPGIFGNKNQSYSKYAFTHRQYITLYSKRLSFAYRLAYQGKLHNSAPSYMLPIVFNYSRFSDKDGLGGSKNLRGITRNRVVGDDFAYGNFEFRWKFIRTVLLNQNIYVALSAFTDMGVVTRDYAVNLSNVPPEGQIFFPSSKEKLHQSIGAGLHFALNENFIIAFDYGVALDARDGDSGLYINLNWLY